MFNKIRNDHGPLSLRDLIVLSIAFMAPTIPAFLYYREGAIANGVAATTSLIALGAILLTVLSFRTLYGAFPSSGSVFTYANNGIHPYAGFLAGWVSILFYILAPACALLMSAQLLSEAIPIIPTVVILVPLVAFTAFVNRLGTKAIVKVCQVLFLIALALVIIYIFVCFISAAKGMGVGKIISLQPFVESGLSFTALLSTSAILCFAFLGFETSSLYTAEADKPEVNVGKALLFSCIIIGAVLFFQAYSSELIVVHDGNTLLSLDDIARKTGGAPMKNIYSIALIFSGIMVGIVGQSAAIKMISFMGKHNALPHSVFGRKQADGSPSSLNMIIVAVAVFVITLIPVAIASLEQLMIFAGALIFVVANVTVIVHFYIRKNGNNIVNYLILPAIGLLFALFMCVHVNLRSIIAGILWIALGCAILFIKKVMKVPPVRGKAEDQGAPQAWDDGQGYDNDDYGYDEGYDDEYYDEQPQDDGWYDEPTARDDTYSNQPKGPGINWYSDPDPIEDNRFKAPKTPDDWFAARKAKRNKSEGNRTQGGYSSPVAPGSPVRREPEPPFKSRIEKPLSERRREQNNPPSWNRPEDDS